MKGNENKALKLGRLALSSIPILHYINGDYNSFDLSAAKRMFNEYKLNTGDENISFDEFIDTYKNKLKAASFELRTIVGLAVIALLAKALAQGIDAPYEDDYLNRAIAWGANTNYRLWNRSYHEAAFFVNPYSALEFIDNPMAVVGIIKTIGKWAPNTADEIRDFVTGTDYKGTFLWEEDPNDIDPALKYTTRLIPGINAAQDFFDWFGTMNLSSF